MLSQHRHASETTFKWRFAGGPMMARLEWYLDPSSPHQLKKKKKKRCQVGPSWQNFLGPRIFLNVGSNIFRFVYVC